jgi:hypothetical protein
MANSGTFCILYAVLRIKFYLEISTGFVYRENRSREESVKKVHKWTKSVQSRWE